MPVTKANRRRYPRNWKAIAHACKERAGWCCQGSPAFPDCRAAHKQPHPVTGSRVILTAAHLDHMPEHCADENLRAWCQRCHLRYDQEHHARNVSATAARKRRLRQAARARAAKSDAVKRARVMAGRETFNAWVMGRAFTWLAVGEALLAPPPLPPLRYALAAYARNVLERVAC